MKVEIEEVREVIGRGTIFLVDLQKCGYTEVGYIEEIPIKIGQTIEFRDEKYMVTGIEAQRIFDAYFKARIGLKVRKINYVEENIGQSTTPSR